jgi:chorismate mutase/prephenate dehydratase
MSDPASLSDLRKRIDALDEQIVQLVNKRAEIVCEIGRLKAREKASFYAPAREQEVYEHVVRSSAGPMSEKALKAIFREIMSGCIELGEPLAIAYLGPVGTFTHWAARSKFGDSVQFVSCQTMGEVFTEVERKRADYGVVPVENSTEGGIRETLARFLDSPLKVCAEIAFEIHHCLLARCKREQITKVYSKGTVFAQTRTWLRNNLPNAELVDVASTSRGAELAAKEHGAAAIGHISAAAVHGLDVLAHNIEDLSHNVTRFFVLGHHVSKPTGDDKTSILVSVKDKAGALHDLLTPFKKWGISMTFIESFPSPKTAWQYYFFIDFLGHPEEEKTRPALECMEQECESFVVLGAYPRFKG